MFIMQISKHHADNCPMFNEKSKESMVALIQKMEPLLAKHAVKMVGSWTDIPAHEIYMVYEAPNTDVFMSMLMEPEFLGWMSFNDVQTRIVVGLPDVKALLNVK
jgi:hypothetical protein